MCDPIWMADFFISDVFDLAVGEVNGDDVRHFGSIVVMMKHPAMLLHKTFQYIAARV